MTYTHLVSKKSKSSIHFHFRSKIPKALISYFNETKQFQISLNNVRKRETLLLSLTLKSIVQQLYSDIRSGMENLTLDKSRRSFILIKNTSFLTKQRGRKKKEGEDDEKVFHLVPFWWIRITQYITELGLIYNVLGF